MVSGRPAPPDKRGFDTFNPIGPYAKFFGPSARNNLIKPGARSEILIFDNISGAATSAAISTNTCKRISVNATGSLNAKIQVSATPDDSSSWNDLSGATVTPAAPWTTTNFYPHIRIVYTSGTGSCFAYKDYGFLGS